VVGLISLWCKAIGYEVIEGSIKDGDTVSLGVDGDGLSVS
jgi:hypothetical protein